MKNKLFIIGLVIGLVVGSVAGGAVGYSLQKSPLDAAGGTGDKKGKISFYPQLLSLRSVIDPNVNPLMEVEATDDYKEDAKYACPDGYIPIVTDERAGIGPSVEGVKSDKKSFPFASTYAKQSFSGIGTRNEPFLLSHKSNGLKRSSEEPHKVKGGPLFENTYSLDGKYLYLATNYHGYDLLGSTPRKVEHDGASFMATDIVEMSELYLNFKKYYTFVKLEPKEKLPEEAINGNGSYLKEADVVGAKNLIKVNYTPTKNPVDLCAGPKMGENNVGS